MKTKHIVIIEDEVELLEAQQLMLSNAGYQVTTISEINTLDELLLLQADLFIVDEKLPNVSGHIICVYLRSKPQTRHIPLVLVSGYLEVAEFADLCEADAWLRKPFDQEELLATVHQLTDTTLIP